MVSRGLLAEETMEQSSNDTSKSHYSFGDNRLAALRLGYLAAAFAPSSRRFLQGTKPSRVELALDLGSGIGATTALVRDVTNAPWVAGYERSANFLAIARRRRCGDTRDFSLARDSCGRGGHGWVTRDESGNLEGRPFHAGDPWLARSR